MTEKIKVLFLDVDGVLNTYRDWDTLSPDLDIRRLNRILVDRLLGVVEQTACKLVLSSTWRFDEGSVGFLKQMKLDIYSCTGNAQNFRGFEIEEWLSNNLEVERYVIVDDDSDMLERQLPYFVQTDPEHGLTETVAYRIVHKPNKGSRYEKQQSEE